MRASVSSPNLSAKESLRQTPVQLRLCARRYFGAQCRRRLLKGLGEPQVTDDVVGLGARYCRFWQRSSNQSDWVRSSYAMTCQLKDGCTSDGLRNVPMYLPWQAHDGDALANAGPCLHTLLASGFKVQFKVQGSARPVSPSGVGADPDCGVVNLEVGHASTLADTLSTRNRIHTN